MRKKFNVEARITPGTRIEGTVRSKGTLEICGRVEGDIFHEGRLIIGREACCLSSIKAEDLVVAGEVYGKLQVRGKLEILSGGKLYGTIQCGKLQIHAGGIFQGTSEMEGAEKAAPGSREHKVEREPAVIN